MKNFNNQLHVFTITSDSDDWDLSEAQCVIEIREATWLLLLVVLTAALVVCVKRFKRKASFQTTLESRGRRKGKTPEDGSATFNTDKITLRKAYEETPMTKSFTDLTPKSLEADSEQNDDIGFQLFAILEEIQSLDHMVRNLEDKKKCCQKMTSRLPEMTVETGRLECHIVESSEISAKLYTELGRVNGFKACECELKDVEELMQLILEEMCPKNTLPKIKDDQDEEECSEHFFPDVVLQVCIKDRTLKECLEIIFSEFEALKLYAERLEKDKEAIQIEKQHALKLLHDANEANLRMSEELCALKQQKVAAAVDLIAPDELQQDLENAVEAKLEEKEMNQKLEDMLVRITDTITVMYQTLKSIK